MQPSIRDAHSRDAHTASPQLRQRVLALSPFHAGSHRAFFEGWAAASRHAVSLCSLPGRHWKWRMRHSGLTLARQVAALAAEGADWDCVVATDMLDLPAWRGFLASLAPQLSGVPAAVYFHENQLTYPARSPEPRDLHFAYTNFLSAVAANAVWFNSQYHREEFLNAVPRLLQRLPDSRHVDQCEVIRHKARVLYPGIDAADIDAAGTSSPQCEADSHRVSAASAGQPLRLVWVARWEHDKGPGDFFAALRSLRTHSLPFRVSVLGESYGRVPECFVTGQQEFAGQVDQWGYLESRQDYQEALQSHDVVVSTARHEFFGIAVLEAAAAGCVPALPARLAYPELFAETPQVFYGQTAAELSRHLRQYAALRANAETWSALRRSTQQQAARFDWRHAAEGLDAAVDALATQHPGLP